MKQEERRQRADRRIAELRAELMASRSSQPGRRKRKKRRKRHPPRIPHVPRRPCARAAQVLSVLGMGSDGDSGDSCSTCCVVRLHRVQQSVVPSVLLTLASLVRARIVILVVPALLVVFMAVACSWLVLLVRITHWPRSPLTSVVFTRLVLLVTLQFAVFPPFVGMSTWRSSRFLPAQSSDSLILLVTMHFALSSFRCRHVGGGPTLAVSCAWLVLLVTILTFHAVFPSVVDRPWMLCIMAGMAQKGIYAAGFYAPVSGSHCWSCLRSTCADFLGDCFHTFLYAACLVRQCLHDHVSF